MKTRIISILTLMAAVFTLSSCSDDSTEGLTRITYYAKLELNGDEAMTVPVGTTFNDPGCKALMKGEDVSDQVIVTGTVDTNTPDFYSIDYLVVNEDGFKASTSRTVAVVDPSNFASPYFSACQYGSRQYSNLPVKITDNGDGTYTIDDLAGGFYAYGRYPGYPYDFSYEAKLKLNAYNTVSLVEEGDGSEWYWEIPLTITSGKYDAANGKIELLIDLDGDPLTVTLTK